MSAAGRRTAPLGIATSLVAPCLALLLAVVVGAACGPGGGGAARGASSTKGGPPGTGRSLPSAAAVHSYVDSLARAALKDGPGAGLSIGVVRGSDTLAWGGWGKANVELGVAAGPQTVYRIGSVTKQFTAALILREVDAGRVSLDDPITKYVPDYDTHGQKVTLREILRHTGGIPNYTASPKFSKEMRLDLTPQQVLAMTEKDSLDFAPGTHWSYSNTDYYLLGLVLEKVTGRPYDELIDDSLAAPLGLRHTSYCWREPIVPGRAEGYEATDSLPVEGKLDHPVLANAAPLSMGPPFAAGALCSTIGDLVRWTGLLHAGKVVSPASFRLMSASDTLPDGLSTHYGFGLVVDSVAGHRVVWHNGGINGFLTCLARFPDDSLTVVVLSNSTSLNPDRLDAQIARFALGAPAPPSTVRPLPDGLAARITGTYRGVGGHPMDIALVGDTLMARSRAPKPRPLSYFGNGPGGVAVFGLGPRPGSGPRLLFHLPSAAGAKAQRMTIESALGQAEMLRAAER